MKLKSNNEFPGFPRPVFTDTLRFPADITRLSSSNVSDLLGKYTQLFAYANHELALVNIAILETQTRISHRRNFLFRRSPHINAQERWRRDAVVDSDLAIEQLEQELTKHKQRKELMAMYCLNFERYSSALSRELSRKTSENRFAPSEG